MAFSLVHKDSSFVASDKYDSLEDAIEATTKDKHCKKIVKISKEGFIDKKIGYFFNGTEVSGYSF